MKRYKIPEWLGNTPEERIKRWMCYKSKGVIIYEV